MVDAGTEINHYLVIEHVGRGGMADVWSARDRKLNRTVAIKTIARDLGVPDSEPAALFQREAQMIARLEHPNILPVYDYGDHDGQLYIVMRYVTGGSLETLIAQGPLAIEDALRIGRVLASALDYAHANSVVHLDIKPSNILLDSSGAPYLADFGLATVMEQSGRAANPGYGTLLYMAPEQLTSEALDHRADIYSFTILIFHMLTGELPFDATTSLAIKQLQSQEDLPNLAGVRTDLPSALTPVLRRGTALNPDHRPNTLGELMAEVEAVLLSRRAPQLAAASGLFADAEAADAAGAAAGATIDLSDVIAVIGPEEMARREALDLYTRARRAWAYGQGRFLLGITHFMLINDFYTRADALGLELDEAGAQMMLRGALEYDHDVDYWWGRLDDGARRWVALHAVRSDSAPARERACCRLVTLPDSEPPRIAALVAQALQVEAHPGARQAAIHLLTARGAAGAGGGWRQYAHSPEIDSLLAEIALEAGAPPAAEQAARAVGRLRSLAAVGLLADRQRQGAPGALRALALVRDEAPSLPPLVSQRARFYAWLANTWRRAAADPLRIVWRYAWAVLGGLVAVAGYVLFNLPAVGALQAQTTGVAVSTGLTFGAFLGLVALLGGEFPARMAGFWGRGARLLAGALLGTLAGALTWGAFTWFFLNYPPDWGVMLLAGLGLAAGFALAGAFALPGWLAAALTAGLVYATLYVGYTSFSAYDTPAVIYFFDSESLAWQAAFIALLVALGGHALALLRGARGLLGRYTRA